MPSAPQTTSRMAGTPNRRFSRASSRRGRGHSDGEGDERDDEDDRRPPREQPARDREVLAADEAVGERGVGQRGDARGGECGGGGGDARPAPHDGVTSRLAIWVPAFSSSTSKRPSIVALKVKVTLPPFSTSFIKS